MSLLRSILLVVVVICAATLCAAQWPCPDASDITPCICTADATYAITMDCSEVTSDDRLVEVFQTSFAFNDFKQLIIQPVTPYPSLLELPAGVFGDVSFQEIDITGTYINNIGEEVLVNSHDTLWRLNLGGNELSTFPVETLEVFSVLQEFDASYNKLSGDIPDIVSDTLFFFDMSGNSGLRLTVTAFQGAPYLEDLRLNSMGLGDTTPANVFLTLRYLRTLYLENNDIPGTLIEEFINPEGSPLITLHLEGNLITAIHPLSVQGMNPAGTVSFRNNLIEYLPEEEWEGLVEQLSNANAIDTRDNPLVCGCDLWWLVFDTNLMAIFHEETTCVTGNYIVDLPQDWFLLYCS